MNYPNGWRRVSVLADMSIIDAGDEWVGRLAWRPVPAIKFSAEREDGGGYYTVNSTGLYVPKSTGSYGFGFTRPQWDDARTCLENGADAGAWKILGEVRATASGWVDMTLSGPTAGQTIMVTGGAGFYSTAYDYIGMISEARIGMSAFPEAAETPCVVPIYLGGAMA
jgi:hypothetical protein